MSSAILIGTDYWKTGEPAKVRYYLHYWSEPKGEDRKWRDPQWIKSKALSSEEVKSELATLRSFGYRQFRLTEETIRHLSIEELQA